jgi:hypothetical protein
MSVMLDGKLIFVLNLIGFNWPQADEDKLKESARHWREYATELEHVIADTNRILEQVRAENRAESIDALEEHWREFGQHLHQAHDAAGTVGEVLDDFAWVVVGLKGKVVAQLLILAGELAATTGAAFLTFGVAEAAAPEEIIATQGFMRWITNVAIQKVEHLVADKIAKKVVEHFLSIKNGLKALKASRTALKDFGRGLLNGGAKDLEHAGAKARPGRQSALTQASSYTFERHASSIEKDGLRKGSWATPAGDLSPLQAQVELALPPNRGLPDLVVRINLAGLREAGYEIPAVTRVSNVVRGVDGRVYSMPGGGWEMQFRYPIPPEFVTVVR